MNVIPKPQTLASRTRNLSGREGRLINAAGTGRHRPDRKKRLRETQKCRVVYGYQRINTSKIKTTNTVESHSKNGYIPVGRSLFAMLIRSSRTVHYRRSSTISSYHRTVQGKLGRTGLQRLAESSPVYPTPGTKKDCKRHRTPITGQSSEHRSSCHSTTPRKTHFSPDIAFKRYLYYLIHPASKISSHTRFFRKPTRHHKTGRQNGNSAFDRLSAIPLSRPNE